MKKAQKSSMWSTVEAWIRNILIQNPNMFGIQAPTVLFRPMFNLFLFSKKEASQTRTRSTPAIFPRPGWKTFGAWAASAGTPPPSSPSTCPTLVGHQFWTPCSGPGMMKIWTKLMERPVEEMQSCSRQLLLNTITRYCLIITNCSAFDSLQLQWGFE